MITKINNDGTKKTYRSLDEYYNDFSHCTVEEGLRKLEVLHLIGIVEKKDWHINYYKRENDNKNESA